MAGDDPGVLVNAALALAYFGEDIGAMMALIDRALALNPNFARGWHNTGYCCPGLLPDANGGYTKQSAPSDQG